MYVYIEYEIKMYVLLIKGFNVFCPNGLYAKITWLTKLAYFTEFGFFQQHFYVRGSKVQDNGNIIKYKKYIQSDRPRSCMLMMTYMNNT